MQSSFDDVVTNMGFDWPIPGLMQYSLRQTDSTAYISTIDLRLV